MATSGGDGEDIVVDVATADVSKEQKQGAARRDAIKTGLQMERTWFKWLFTGLQIGAFGTWVLKFFSIDGRDTLYILCACWVVATLVIAKGLERYYARRRTLKSGEEDPREYDNPGAIVAVTAAVTAVIGGVVLYSVWTRTIPSKKN